jgi:hypothetical protein
MPSGRRAQRHEVRQRHLFRHAAATRMQHADLRSIAGRQGNRLDLPHSLAAIAAVLLEHARAGRLQSRREFCAERRRRAVEMRVGAPAEVPGAMQDLLYAHLEDDVRVRADPRTARRHIAQQRVKHRARLALVNRIDPDQHAIDLQELLAHLVCHVIGKHRRLGLDAGICQLLEHAMEAVVLRRGSAACVTIATPEHRHPGRPGAIHPGCSWQCSRPRPNAHDTPRMAG